jgi:hypothetical protein
MGVAQQVPRHRGADEAGSARDKDGFATSASSLCRFCSGSICKPSPLPISSRNTVLSRFCRELLVFICDPAPFYFLKTSTAMPMAKVRASTILAEFDRAQAELVDKAVILTDGKAGTVEHVWLDELHGLRISIRGHEGRWPVSTIKLAQTDLRPIDDIHIGPLQSFNAQ